MSSPKDLSSTSFKLSDFIQTQAKPRDIPEVKTQISEHPLNVSEHEKHTHWLLQWAY